MPEAVTARTTTPRYLHWGLTALTLLVLAAGTAAVTLYLRGVIREKIVERDAQVLYAAAVAVAESRHVSEEALQNMDVEGSKPNFIELSEKELAYLFSTLKAVLAMRLFDEEGHELFRLPEPVVDRPISDEAWAKLKALQPMSRFHKDLPLGAFFAPEAGALPMDVRVPLIEAYVPLEQDGELIGFTTLLLDGRDVAEALAALDKELLIFGCLIFLVGGTIIATAMAWAFGRLQRANRLLLKRTESLSLANHQLALAAKTSAIGAVTAHLIHDLKNPLFGLEHFVSSRGGNDDEDREEWELALVTTRRMQKVISDVVRILQEEKGDLRYEITLPEIGALLKSKLEQHFKDAGLRLELDIQGTARLNNKDANLIILVATNLIQNAVQATPEGGVITFRTRETAAELVFEVQDTGPGLPPHLLRTLFAPCRSGKKGGTGLGLAISKQLASHMKGELALKESSEKGTTFQLTIAKEMVAVEEKEEEEFGDLALP